MVPALLVGRDIETATLRARVAACAAGHGRATLIGGEPGIGKSALVRDVCDAAAAAGLTVLRGAGDELGQVLPLLPFLAALEVSGGAAAEEPGGRRAAVLRLLRGEQEFRAVDAVSAAAEQLFALVEESAARRPTLLAIDDLQWADQASVALWARLARAAGRHRLLLVGAVRTAPGDVLRALRRVVEPADLLRPGPLAAPAVDALLTASVGARPGPRLTRLAAGAAGNPLYITELVGALARAGRLAEGPAGVVDFTGARPADGAPDPAGRTAGADEPLAGGVSAADDAVPPSLAAAIADRLDFLSDEVRPTLRAAALLGVHFDVEDLAAVQRCGVAELVPVLDVAISAGVLADSAHGLGFRHPLIRAALYEELAPSVRRAWHRDAARALAAAAAPVDRVARQLLPAAEPGVPLTGWMLDWLVEAGPPLTAQAPTVAIDLLRRAVAGPGRPGERTYGMLARHLADALSRAGEQAEAERVAFTALGRVTDAEVVTELHWSLAQVRLNAGRVTDALDDLDRALAAPHLAERHRARLLTMKARIVRWMGDIDLAGALADEALDGATATGDTATVAWALHTRIVVLALRGEQLALPPLFDRALAAVADEPRLADLRLLLENNRAVVLGAVDRMGEAIAQATAVCAAAARTGSVLRLAGAHGTRGELLYDAGRWDEALADVTAFPDEVKDVSMVCNAHGIAALVLLHRGGIAEARRHLERGIPAAATIPNRLVGSLVAARALLAEHEGRPADALATLTAWISGDQELTEVIDLLPDGLRLAREHGDPATRAAMLALADSLWAKADVPHRAGLVHYGRGLHSGDPAVLRRAAACFRTAERPLWTATALGAAAVAAAEAGDRAGARAAFSDAVDGYERLGAAWDVARLQARMWAFGIRRAPRVKHRTARHGWDSLTPSEQQVVALVLRGLSNPQIAEELYVSPRTVGTHVSRILAKLDLSSRTDLVREAARRG
ncbi:LuxR family transcriptional regulator [Virgisporangium aliadipatigenens]|uniref:LuxR family transcriptional regulator n=1 Tax=Virgisporangium aliadipatigenens TaxID=741659 RepID=A0A8J3YER5_9ACTN|nr:LuxR family transcriptional regulator [Virgisporangium aliadipatigenens]GIJ43789.1 LuxR family transcriptional regulator [Virgisporangium aliadipatigenens]